ncbi:MAG TPA: DoxX family protein, partial [Candidatus Acidoferrales bacterium]|nr:DoxX family protein [Candidatus Acidoferrales bacterium]
ASLICDMPQSHSTATAAGLKLSIQATNAKDRRMKFLSGLEPVAYAVFRVVVGFLFLCHGAQKLFGAFGGHAQLHNPMMLAAGIIEFGGGILIILGLLTRFVAFIASGEMAVAYFMMHQPRGHLPIQNGGAEAVLFCFAFLYIACHGAGKFAAEKD